MRTVTISAMLAVLTALLPGTAVADSWTPSTPLTDILGPGAVVLPSGKVFVSGNQYASSDARSEIFDPATGVWSAATRNAIGPLALLGDGTVLIAGTTPQVYDPVTNTAGPAKPIFTGIPASLPLNLSTVALADGGALAVGGVDGGGNLGGAYHYRPASGPPWWTASGDVVKRTRMTLTLLRDGTVLAAGGNVSGPTAAAGIYESQDRWSPTNSMISPRDGHTATLLPDGRVLIAGGRKANVASSVVASAEIYTPATGQWAPARSMAQAREDASATLLRDGRVLVAGGSDGTGTLSTSELYDPATNTWSAGPKMAEAVKGHAAVLLPSGRVLVAGGFGAGTLNFAGAQIYTPDPAPTGGGTGGAGGGGTTGGGAGGPAASGAPALSAARLSASRFRAAGRGGMLTRTSLGTRIIYTDSLAATTTFTVKRATVGRRAGARCVAPARARKGARRCTLLTTLGSARHADVAGRNVVPFSGRVKGRKLALGTYRLSLVARTAGGAASAPRNLTFTITG